MFGNANPSNWYRLSFSNFHSSVFLQPISVVQPDLLPWRQTTATGSVSTWAWPDGSMAIRVMGALDAGSHKRQSGQGNFC